MCKIGNFCKSNYFDLVSYLMFLVTGYIFGRRGRGEESPTSFLFFSREGHHFAHQPLIPPSLFQVSTNGAFAKRGARAPQKNKFGHALHILQGS